MMMKMMMMITMRTWCKLTLYVKQQRRTESLPNTEENFCHHRQELFTPSCTLHLLGLLPGNLPGHLPGNYQSTYPGNLLSLGNSGTYILGYILSYLPECPGKIFCFWNQPNTTYSHPQSLLWKLKATHGTDAKKQSIQFNFSHVEAHPRLKTSSQHFRFLTCWKLNRHIPPSGASWCPGWQKMKTH